MVKLTPEQQQLFMKKAPGVFRPCGGTWGLRGSTNVYLASVDADALRAALELAAKNVTTPAKKKRA
jgi:hypothetical protein